MVTLYPLSVIGLLTTSRSAVKVLKEPALNISSRAVGSILDCLFNILMGIVRGSIARNGISNKSHCILGSYLNHIVMVNSSLIYCILGTGVTPAQIHQKLPVWICSLVITIYDPCMAACSRKRRTVIQIGS